jgi:hypothetical protein
MATPGTQLLMRRHLDALNRLRRLGRGSVKLSSEHAPMRNQIENVLAASGLAPEKQAEIYKKILLKATPVTPGVIPKESDVTGVPPDSSHAPGLAREAGRIHPGQDDTNPKIANYIMIAKTMKSRIAKKPVGAHVTVAPRPAPPRGITPRVGLTSEESGQLHKLMGGGESHYAAAREMVKAALSALAGRVVE